MAADLDGDGSGPGVGGRIDLVERPLPVGVEMRDGAGPDIADQRRFGHQSCAAAAEQARRLDAEIFGDDRDLVGPEAPVAVEKVGDGRGRTAERLGEAAAGFAGVFKSGADPVDGQWAPLWVLASSNESPNAH